MFYSFLYFSCSYQSPLNRFFSTNILLLYSIVSLASFAPANKKPPLGVLLMEISDSWSERHRKKVILERWMCNLFPIQKNPYILPYSCDYKQLSLAIIKEGQYPVIPEFWAEKPKVCKFCCKLLLVLCVSLYFLQKSDFMNDG